MPYRGLERPTTACYRHAAAQASETCVGCVQTICDICVGYENTQPHCPPCAKKARQRRSIARSVTGAVGVAAVAGLIAGAIFLGRGEAKRSERELCDRAMTLNISESMLRAGNNVGALERIDAFTAKCGNWSRLSWVAYTAHEQLNDHAAAIVDATGLIDESPDDKDFWWWRGLAYEQLGQLDQAVSDYRQALEVEPRLGRIPFNLASVLERQGKFCDARQPILQFLQFHPDVPDRQAVEQRLSRLDAHCAK